MSPKQLLFIRRFCSLLLIASAGLLAGCQTLSFAPKVTPMTELPKPTARTCPDEKIDVLNQRSRGYGLARLPRLEAYLNDLYARIKKQAGVADWPGRVYLLSTPRLEAYATGAGNIYLSPSEISSAESEDELVALLSHEFAHVYLHYHQVDDTLQGTNTIAEYAIMGLQLWNPQIASVGASATEIFKMSYVASRDLLSANYSQAQEIAADNFALAISMKMNYSYETGVKAFLERAASFEDQNREAAKAKQQATNAANQAKQPENPGAALGNAVGTALSGIFTSMNEGVKKTLSSHPDTQERMDNVANTVETLPPEMLDRTPTLKPFKAAISHAETATALNNYQLAGKVMNDLQDRTSISPALLSSARKAASGPTAKHAFPLAALYNVQLALQAHPDPRYRSQVDPALTLDQNIRSEEDRAWTTFTLRAAGSMSKGKSQEALKTLTEGFQYFSAGSEVWPEAVTLTGQLKGWPEAKLLAKRCEKEQPVVAKACTQAALSPVEADAANREAQAKADLAAKQVGHSMMRKIGF